MSSTGYAFSGVAAVSRDQVASILNEPELHRPVPIAQPTAISQGNTSPRRWNHMKPRMEVLTATLDASQFANALLAPVEGSRVEAGVLPPLTLVDKYGANLAASFGCSVSVSLSGGNHSRRSSLTAARAGASA